MFDGNSPGLTAIANRPLLIDPNAIAQLASALDPTAASRGAVAHGAQRVEGRIAHLEIAGPLLTRTSWGGLGYNDLATALRTAAADPNVASIIISWDSPGGVVAGIEGAADAMISARRSKPVHSFVGAMAASAAYWLASQSDSVTISPLAQVGSIGVSGLHVDISRALDRAGITPTIIYSGAHKADGSSFAPLPKSVRDEWQADVDALRVEFAAAVVAGRPGIDLAKAMGTEARMFRGQAAVDAGLADRVGSVTHAIAMSHERRAIRAPDAKAIATASTQNAAGSWDKVIADLNARNGFAPKPVAHRR